MKRKEKILKELEKKYEIEKNRTTKLDENLKTSEEELKVTKKVNTWFLTKTRDYIVSHVFVMSPALSNL